MNLEICAESKTPNLMVHIYHFHFLDSQIDDYKKK
jgi:hypothetical protein